MNRKKLLWNIAFCCCATRKIFMISEREREPSQKKLKLEVISSLLFTDIKSWRDCGASEILILSDRPELIRSSKSYISLIILITKQDHIIIIQQTMNFSWLFSLSMFYTWREKFPKHPLYHHCIYSWSEVQYRQADKIFLKFFGIYRKPCRKKNNSRQVVH